MMRNSAMSQNSQIIKRIEDLERMRMTSSHKKNYINAHFLHDSNTRIDLEFHQFHDDHQAKDINLISEEYLLEMIQHNQIVLLALETPAKKQSKFDLMLQNANKINNTQFYLINSNNYMINTQFGCICKNYNLITQQKNLIHFLLK